MNVKLCKLPGCVHPAGDSLLCRQCGRDLRVVLNDAEWLVEDLAVVLSRQTRYGGGRVAHSDTRPLIYDQRAADVLVRLDKVLAATVDAVAAHTGTPERPTVGLAASARWIAARVVELRRHPQAPDIARALFATFKAAERAVDRPADRWYAGPCNNEIPVDDELPEGDEVPVRYCGAGLYASVGAELVKCRRCDAEYDVGVRREWLLDAAEHELVDAATLARAVSWLGTSGLTSERIRQWKRRGRLTPAAVQRCNPCLTRPVVRPCPADRPLYRVGDAIDLLAQHAASRNGITSC